MQKIKEENPAASITRARETIDSSFVKLSLQEALHTLSDRSMPGLNVLNPN